MFMYMPTNGELSFCTGPYFYALSYLPDFKSIGPDLGDTNWGPSSRYQYTSA